MYAQHFIKKKKKYAGILVGFGGMSLFNYLIFCPFLPEKEKKMRLFKLSVTQVRVHNARSYNPANERA